VILREWTEPVDLLALHEAFPERYPALFQTGGSKGWDILFACPTDVWRFHAGQLAQLADILPVIRPDHLETSGLPFRGGWVVVLGYELAGLLEPHAGSADDPESFPLVWLARVPAAILRQNGRTWIVAERGFEVGLRIIEEDLLSRPGEVAPWQALPTAIEEEDAGIFLHNVARIQDYIRAGDVFQVNLSRGWQARYAEKISAAGLFKKLMRSNPSPFSALIDMGDWKIVSSSPERLACIDQTGRILTRPIAGTRPRSRSGEQDEALRAALLASAKERAEHVMLVDLERNDLGRVCVPGTVRVDALMELTSYAHVHHIESTVTGRLRNDTSVWDVVRAVFPGGTITGCPKVRTMEIIRELEAVPRRAYTGSLGYINTDGTMDLNILIRSFLLKGARLDFRAGAGIVADSVPERELEETRAKAMGLLNALNVESVQ
jgi:anthranilate synthase component 1